MDTTILVEKLRIAFDAIQKDGIALEAVALSRAYPSFESSPFVLMVAAPSLSDKSIGQKVRAISSKLFDLLSAESLRRIDRVYVYNSKQELIRDMEEEEGFEVAYEGVELMRG